MFSQSDTTLLDDWLVDSLFKLAIYQLFEYGFALNAIFRSQNQLQQFVIDVIWRVKGIVIAACRTKRQPQLNQNSQAIGQ
jgi:hypothetical protein